MNTGQKNRPKDVIGHKRVEEVLRESEERFRLVVENAPHGIFIQVNSRFTYVNTAALKMFGAKSPDDILGKPVLSMVASEYHDQVRERIRMLNEERIEVSVVEEDLLRLDGTPFPVEASAVPFTYQGDAGALVFFIDVTERKHARKEARRLLTAVQTERDRVSAIVNSIQDEVWFADTQKKFTLANPSALQEFQLNDQDEIDVEDFARNLEVHRPDGTERPIEEAPALRALKGEIVRNQEEMIKTKRRGEFRYRSVNASPVRDRKGKIIGSVSVVRDITDSKKAEKELRKAREELEMRVQSRTAELEQALSSLQAEIRGRLQLEEKLRHSQKMEAIGTLAGGVAHDFNNILAGIIGFAEMVEEDLPDGSPLKRYMQRILKASLRGRDLVKQILAFSRKTEHTREIISLIPVINDTVQLLRASIPSTVEIMVNIKTGSDKVHASAIELQQIVMNLATNAAKAMSAGGGKLTISLSEIDFQPDSPVIDPDVEPGEYIQLVVEDTGIGMTPDIMKRIFEPFFTTHRVGEGTGMGLAAVYGIIKSLNGTITVESQPGTGSVFRIFFPKASPDAVAPIAELHESPLGSEKILFIDDEEILAELGDRLLRKLGYSVEAFTDPHKAFETFATDPASFDMIITDQTMPGITGFNLAKKVRTIRGDIPIILCTGHSDSVSPEMAREANVAFIMKPIAKAELAKIIRDVLDND